MKIIAELCQNHKGNFSILKNMVQSASEYGATHVKIQHIYSKNLSRRGIFENGEIKNNKIITIKRPYKQEYKRLKKLELNRNDIIKFVTLCNQYKVIPLTTCFAREHIKEIKNLGFKEIKVASYDCSSYQMLRELKKNFSHIYLSTGASYNQEIKKASDILKNNFSLLHCVTEYPTKINNVNLSRLNFLRNFSSEVGYSDHTNPEQDKLLASLSSIYFGAKILERHFTILPKDKTRDGPVSINPTELMIIKSFTKLSKTDQLKELKKLNFKRNILLGSKNLQMTHEEKLNRDYYRGRFVSFANDKRGKFEVFNWEETPIN